DLKEAIEDVLAGRKARVKETAVDGCAITFPEVRKPNPSLTFAKHIAPLLNQHCVQCHRPGSVAPFSLISYEKAAAKAATIAEVVEELRMPPLFEHSGFAKFLNQHCLTAEEQDTNFQWAGGGR